MEDYWTDSDGDERLLSIGCNRHGCTWSFEAGGDAALAFQALEIHRSQVCGLPPAIAAA